MAKRKGQKVKQWSTKHYTSDSLHFFIMSFYKEMIFKKWSIKKMQQNRNRVELFQNLRRNLLFITYRLILTVNLCFGSKSIQNDYKWRNTYFLVLCIFLQNTHHIHRMMYSDKLRMNLPVNYSNICLLGDFNSRTAAADDFILVDEKDKAP